MADSSINDRLATARAVAEALVGIPIVLSQQLVQNIGDVRLNDETTVAQRVGQLRSLGEMVVRVGVRQARQRFGGSRS